MSWYGLLAGRIRARPCVSSSIQRPRLEPEAPLRRALEREVLPEVETLRVAREPALSLAIAYLRLGRAGGHICPGTLLAAGQLRAAVERSWRPSMGMRQEQARQRVLRYGIFIAPASRQTSERCIGIVTC